MTTKKKVKGLTLGADPEGLLVQMQGPRKFQIVPASSYIKEGDEGSRGYALGWGLDGHSTTPELRFDPCANAFEIVSSIQPYMAKVAKVLPADIKLCAGSGTPAKYNGRYVSSGGHIHMRGFKNWDGDMLKNICDALDYLLMVPLMMFEDPERAKRRRNGDQGQYRYGMLYNTHKAKIDTNGRTFDEAEDGLEYRPPSSWLVSANFTRDIFALVHAVAYEIDKGGELPKFSKAWKNREAMLKACQAHQNADRTPFKEHLAAIKAALSSTTLYTNGYYRKEIDGLMGLAMAFAKHDKSWDEDSCILSKWGLPRDYAFLSGKVQYPLNGNVSDANINEILSAFGDRRFDRKVYVYGMSDKHGCAFSLHGPFENSDIPQDFFQGNKESRVQPTEYQCWIGIAKQIRVDGDWDEMMKYINEFVKNLEIKDRAER